MPDAHFYRLVSRLSRCGERPVAELLLDSVGSGMLRGVIEEKLENYVQALERLGPDVLHALRADKTPPLILHDAQE